MKEQKSIRASVHKNAVQRVAQFFDASTQQIVDELVQNARRAGASRIEAWTDSSSLIVNDDGCGITDPETVLAFGKSAWNEEINRIEHPAGMGLYSLARLRTRIESRAIETQAGGQPPAWAMNLDLAAFTGKRDIAVETTTDGPRPHGTRTIVQCSDTGSFETAIRRAALYGPVTIFLNGNRLLQRRFMAPAMHVEEWRGLRIGVFMYSGSGLHDWELNFHGREVNGIHLPQVRLMTGWWHVKMEAIACPELELALPARGTLVPTPFLDRLREEAKRIIFRSMRDTEGVNVSAKLQHEARSESIQLPTAAPQLSPWRAESHGAAAHVVGDKLATPEAVPQDAIVMAARMDTATAWMVDRATRGTAIGKRLYQPNVTYEGYPWYDNLSTLAQVTTEVRSHDSVKELNNLGDGQECPRNGRPNTITLKFRIETSDGEPELLETDTDVAFDHDVWFGGLMSDVSVLVTAESAISEDELVELMVDALHHVPQDDEEYCRERKEAFQQEARATARDLLLGPEKSMKKGIEDSVRLNVYPLAPVDREVNIGFTRKAGKDPDISVAVEPITDGSD